MKILNLSLDSGILEDGSRPQRRVLEYGELVEKYDVVVPSGTNKKISLFGKTDIYGVSGKNKFFQLKSIYKISGNLFKQNQYDVVTVQDQYFLALMGLRLSKKFGAGFEMQVHGFEKFSGIRKIIFKFVIKKADSIRVVSKRLKKRLISEFGVDEGRVTVVNIFTDVSKFTGLPSRALETPCNDKMIFLTVGRLVAVKNIEMQIEAMSAIQKKYSNIELWIVGDGEDKEKLENKSKSLNANIKFFDWEDDKSSLDKYYKQADVFLLTSNSEGWGMVVIEAANFGLPVIMTDVGCAGEVIRDNESGLIIPVGNQDELERAMFRVIEDEKLREELRCGAIEIVNVLSSKEETLGRYKESWVKAIKNRK
jgi:glycosyltransferase involved in cell wall biosynthesis